MRRRYFLLGMLCLLTLCGCSLVRGGAQSVPEDFTVGLVRTNGSRNSSDILYFDENLEQTGSMHYPYATMGEIFYAPVVYDGSLYIVPQGQANRKNLRRILKQDLETFEKKEYALDQIAIYGVSVDSSAIYAANNLNGQSFVSRIDRENETVRTVSYDGCYISTVYVWQDKVYAFSEQGTDSGRKSTLHRMEPGTLKEVGSVDISEVGSVVYSVAGVEDTLYFAPKETMEGGLNHKVGTYEMSTGEVGFIEFREPVEHILLEEDKLYVTHGNLVTGEGTALSVYDRSTGEIAFHDLGMWPGQIAVQDDTLYVMDRDSIGKFDLRTMEIQTEVSVSLREGDYLSGIFSYSTGKSSQLSVE